METNSSLQANSFFSQTKHTWLEGKKKPQQNATSERKGDCKDSDQETLPTCFATISQAGCEL